MLKTSFAASALFASIYAAAVAPETTEAVEAGAPQSAPARASEPGCSKTGWPHYQDNCIRGRGRTGLGEQPAQAHVRIVTVDRLPK